MIIRPERSGDAAAIAALVEGAFASPGEARLIDRLRADGDVVMSLVAVEDGAIVGHALLSRMEAPFRALGLAPVSVAPDRQRRGIGAMLIRAALAEAASGEWEAVFVVGEPAYYRRFGFTTKEAAGFDSPYAGPYLMVHALDGTLPATQGAIAYAPAFSELP